MTIFCAVKVDDEAKTISAQACSKHQVYEIRFPGHLDLRRAQMFEGLEMVQVPDGGTVLTGPVLDQAAPYGALAKMRDLSVPLLSVKRLTQDDGSTESSSAKQKDSSARHPCP